MHYSEAVVQSKQWHHTNDKLMRISEFASVFFVCHGLSLAMICMQQRGVFNFTNEHLIAQGTYTYLAGKPDSGMFIPEMVFEQVHDMCQ